MRKILLSLTMVLALTTFAFASISGTLTPDSITNTHDYSETITYTLDYSVTITGEASGDVDVLFLTDTTGSMGSYIVDINIAFSGILSAIDSNFPLLDIEYSVADYRNYYDGGNYTAYGVNLTQPFTADIVAVQTALGALSAWGGGDWPESQLKALQNTALNWLTPVGDPCDPNLGFAGRAGAQKIIIWAGDAEGHICGDLGPPADYYPCPNDTIDALNAAGIQVFGLNVSGDGFGIDTGNQQDNITSDTGGLSFYNVGSGGSSIEDNIIAAITGGVETLNTITVTLQTDDGDFIVNPWVMTIFGPWDANDSPVTGSTTFNAIAPAVDGVADFNMVLLGNGAELDRSDVHLDTETLDCSTASANPAELWPPNHKFTSVTIQGVVDSAGNPASIIITGITSDEPTATIKGAGGSKFSPDADGVGSDTAMLRAERSGKGNGRVYAVSFIAIDDAGRECAGTVTVCVPHDQSPDNDCVDDGQVNDATAVN